MEQLSVVHVLNQFYAGVGGETQADWPLEVRAGAVGPGREVARLLAGHGVVRASLVVGDNWAQTAPQAVEQIVRTLQDLKPDGVLLGPAFGSGRFGLTCGRVAVATQERLGLRTVVTGMHPENPAVDLFRRKLVIVRTTPTAVGMARALDGMVRLLLKLAAGERLGTAEADGYIPRELKRNVFHPRPAAERAVTMVLDRLAGQPFRTEITLPRFRPVPPAAPVRDLTQATLAMVTTGGVVPRGNPDRIESRFASRWGRYAVTGLTAATPDRWEDVHGGFDTHFVNEDPNRVLPLDVLRELEGREFGRLFPDVFSTVGNMMAIDRAEQFARDMASVLAANRIDGVILAVT